MTMGPLKKDDGWEGQGVYEGMIDGHGAVEGEEDLGWEGRGV